MEEEITKILQDLTPAELFYLRKSFKIKEQQLIEITILDIWINDRIVIEKKQAKYTKKHEAFFIKLNYKNLEDIILTYHEKIIVERLSKKEWTSFLELGGFVSNFLNDIYKYYSKGFHFDKYVLSALKKRDLIIKHNPFVFFVRRILNKFPYSPAGYELRNKLMLIDDVFKDPKYISFFKLKAPQRISLLESEFYYEVLRNLKDSIKYQLDHSGYGAMAMSKWNKKYPVPIGVRKSE